MTRTRPRRPRRPLRTRLLLVGMLTSAGLAVAACTSAGSDGGDAGRAADEAGGAAGRSAVDTAVSAVGPVQRRAVVATGVVELVAEDLEDAQQELQRLVERNGGFVADREAVNDDEGRTTSATLRLRVPAGRFETVVAALEDVSTVTGVVTESEDVTTEVIDVESRIRTQVVSLRRLRGFLGRTDDVSELVRVEREIARREASLRSLRAQQAYLANQTSLATLTVHMTTPEPTAAEERPLTEGFGAGLAAGWRGLVTTFSVAATTLGALLPFAVVLLAAGIPAWLLVRRRRTRATPAAGPEE